MRRLTRYFAVLWSPRTWRAYGYLIAGLPLGILWFTYAATGLALSVGLAVIWIGVPLCAVVLTSLRWVGTTERVTLRALLERSVAPPARVRQFVPGRGPAAWQWVKNNLGDGPAWRVALWTSIRLVLGAVGFSVAVAAIVVPPSLAAAIVTAAIIELRLDWWAYDPEAAAIVRDVSFWTVIGAPVLVMVSPALPWAARGLASLHTLLAPWFLGPGAKDLAREATERAELAEEQVRIDQELHDSIGHMITMNVIQAGAGAHVFDTDPEFARQALKNIEERGRAAMGELDRIIATIRGDKPETRAPLPGIDDIESLVASSREAGMDVVAIIDAPQVPNAVGRAAFTVVREALTNVAKHAPGAPCRVDVGRFDDALAIAVLNGPAAPGAVPAGGGGGRRGLAGMRDRIELLGGKQHIGATEAGGFEVLALVPLGARLDLPGTLDETWGQLRERVSA